MKNIVDFGGLTFNSFHSVTNLCAQSSPVVVSVVGKISRVVGDEKHHTEFSA